MLEFKSIEVSDKKWVDEILKKTPRPSMEYNFTTMFIWGKIYNTRLAKKDGFLFYSSGKKTPSFLFPIGEGDKVSAVGELISYAKSLEIPLRFYSLSEEQKEFLIKNFPKQFEFSENIDFEDYVYERESLANLKGKSLSSKRNHINRFIENNPDWKYEKINKDNIKKAIAMHNEWCDHVSCDSEEGLSDETCAVRRAFKYFDELGLKGAMISVGEKIVAFTMGDELNEETFLVHIEKAYADIQGAYPMINKQFVINECEGYRFINREDDAGDEGLRRAKLSYKPIAKIKKIYAKKIQ